MLDTTVSVLDTGSPGYVNGKFQDHFIFLIHFFKHFIYELTFIVYSRQQTTFTFEYVDFVQKSDNLQYGSLGRWDKWLIDQASDVSSIIFFHNFLQNSLQKLFQFIFLFFIILQK